MNNMANATPEELKKILMEAMEIDDDELDAVAGGNDDLKGKESGTWLCPFCGKTIKVKSAQDGAKHVAKDCPNNPLKQG